MSTKSSGRSRLSKADLPSDGPRLKRPSKVLHLITANLPGPYFRALSRSSDRGSFELIFGSLAVRGPLHDEMESLGHETVAFDCMARTRWLSGALKIRRWLQRNQVDVLHAHLFEGCLVGLAAAKAAGTPVRIFSGHHSHEVPHHGSWKLRAADTLSARVLANHVLVHCAQMEELMRVDYGIPRERLSVLPLPFDTKDRNPTPAGRVRIREELGIAGKAVFGAVGRFYWLKDYETLFAAFAPLARAQPDAVLVVAGTGPDEAAVRALPGRHGISAQVVFAGYRSDIADVIDSFDVLVHSAVAESYCQVVVEALSLGKPVVSTAVGIVPELVRFGETGFTAPPRDVPALTVAMGDCWRARSRWTAMGEACRRSVGPLSGARVVSELESRYRVWLAAA